MKKSLLQLFTAILLVIVFTITTVAAGLAFVDVKTTDWFYEDVLYAVQSNLVNGTSPTTYAPNAELTVAEAVKLAAAMHQLDADGEVTLAPGSPWYMPFVNYAKEQGIITKNYDWSEKITRGEYMDIFARALPLSEFSPMNTVDDNAIPDVSMSHMYADEIYMLYRAGVVAGSDSARSTKPNTTIKRSEVAAILTRMMDEGSRVKFSLTLESSDFKVDQQPADVEVKKYESALFAVTVMDGEEPYNYQWQVKSGDTWVDFTNQSNVSGVNTNTLILRSAMVDMLVRCVVSDSHNYEVVSDEAMLTVKQDEIVTEKLEIMTQPTDYQMTASPEVVRFSTRVQGGKAPYTFNWQYSSDRGRTWGDIAPLSALLTDLVGATSADLSYTATVASNEIMRCAVPTL